MGLLISYDTQDTFLGKIYQQAATTYKKKSLVSYTNDGYKSVLLHPIPLLEIFLFFEIWHFLIKSSDFGDWAHQGGFLC